MSRRPRDRLLTNTTPLQRSCSVIFRSLSLRFLLMSCLVLDGAILSTWIVLDPSSFARPLLRWETSLLAVGFLADTLLAISLVVWIVRRRASRAERTEA